MIETNTQLSRRERKKLQTRSAILRAAVRLFSRAGYDSVSVDEIADEADVAKGTLFRYFPSKIDLLKSYLNEVVDENYSKGEKLQGASARLLVKQHHALMIRRWEKEGAMFDMLIKKVFSTSELMDFDRSFYDRRVSLHKKFLQVGIDCGEIRRGIKLGIVVDMFRDVWTGTLVEWAYYDKTFSLQRRMAQKLDILFDGLCPH